MKALENKVDSSQINDEQDRFKKSQIIPRKLHPTSQIKQLKSLEKLVYFNSVLNSIKRGFCLLVAPTGCSFDLGFYAFSVLVESALHALHSSSSTNPKFFADHSDETFVVRNQNNSAGILRDGFSKRFNGFDIQMIRRFVKHKEVWIC